MKTTYLASRYMWIFAVLLHAALHSTTAAAQPATKAEANVTLYDYKVQPGDSCAGIAERELGSRKGYRTIHKYNNLGPLPHKLKAGDVLRLPKPNRTPDAILESRVGKVEYRKAAETIWGNAAKGMDIFRSWRVWSHKKSTAVLIFKDDSILSLRDDTVVVIYGPTAGDGKRKLVRAELETGSLRSRLAALESRLVVDTASSSVELSGGSSVISASGETKRSTVSNHEGGSVAVRQRKKRGTKKTPAVQVAAGKGTWVEAGKAPAPPRDLPPVPELRTAPQLQVALASTGVVLKGSWKPVMQASRYRVEVAIDPNVRIVVAAFEVTKDVTSFEAQGLKPGRYYVSVATIDDKGLESAPSPRQLTEIALLEHKPLDGEASGKLAQGSQLLAPTSLTCSSSEAEPTSSVALLSAGRTTIVCTSADGVTSHPLELEVDGSQIALSNEDSGAANIIRGQTRGVLLTSEPALAATAELRLETEPGISARVVSIGPEGIRLQVDATEASVETSTVRIFRSTEAGEFLLTTVTLDVRSAEALVEEKPERQPRIAVGLVAGVYLSDLEDDGPTPNEAPFVGARASLEVSGRFEVEAEINIARRAADEPYIFASNQVLFAWRQPIGASFFVRSRLGPSLWHNNDPEQVETTTIGLAGGLSIERSIGPGALRLDAGAAAFAGASNRLSGSISYQWNVDLLD